QRGHQVAARRAAMVACLGPVDDLPGERGDRCDARARHAQDLVQPRATRRDGARRLCAGDRGGARGGRPRTAPHPLHLAGQGRRRRTRRGQDRTRRRFGRLPLIFRKDRAMEKSILAFPATIAAATLAVVPASAHRQWMLPSATVLSGDDVWVTVDAAISNDLFYFEHHPLRLDSVKAWAPDGSEAPIENQATGRYRSTF